MNEPPESSEKRASSYCGDLQGSDMFVHIKLSSSKGLKHIQATCISLFYYNKTGRKNNRSIYCKVKINRDVHLGAPSKIFTNLEFRNSSA
jgi:hypothetical protein